MGEDGSGCRLEAAEGLEALNEQRDRFVVSFTGTQLGMTREQRAFVAEMLAKLKARHGSRLRAVHGDCVGADAMFDEICVEQGIMRGIYPSDMDNKRAHCDRRGAKLLSDPMPPLERNGPIAAAGDLLIAVPKMDQEEARSGTWATVRRARSAYANRSSGAIVIVWRSKPPSFDFPSKRQVRLATTPR